MESAHDFLKLQHVYHHRSIGVLTAKITAADFIHVPIYPIHFRCDWGKNGTLKMDPNEEKKSLIYLKNNVLFKIELEAIKF